MVSRFISMCPELLFQEKAPATTSWTLKPPDIGLHYIMLASFPSLMTFFLGCFYCRCRLQQLHAQFLKQYSWHVAHILPSEWCPPSATDPRSQVDEVSRRKKVSSTNNQVKFLPRHEKLSKAKNLGADLQHSDWATAERPAQGYKSSSYTAWDALGSGGRYFFRGRDKIWSSEFVIS